MSNGYIKINKKKNRNRFYSGFHLLFRKSTKIKKISITDGIHYQKLSIISSATDVDGRSRSFGRKTVYRQKKQANFLAKTKNKRRSPRFARQLKALIFSILRVQRFSASAVLQKNVSPKTSHAPCLLAVYTRGTYSGHY